MATINANLTTNGANREAAARSTIEARLGRDVSDQEWALWRARLLAYVKLLKTWDERLGSNDDLG